MNKTIRALLWSIFIWLQSCPLRAYLVSYFIVNFHEWIIGIFYLIVSSFTGLKSRNGLSLTIDLFIQGNSLESVAPTAPGRYTPLLNILLSATTLYIFR